MEAHVGAHPSAEILRAFGCTSANRLPFFIVVALASMGTISGESVALDRGVHKKSPAC